MPHGTVVKFKKRLRSLDEFQTSANMFGKMRRRTTAIQKLGYALVIAAAFAVGYLA